MDDHANLDNDLSTSNAIRLYGQDDAIDDFPVLKAFQQYIDAEQEKARKRLVSMGIFFGVLTFVVIAVFVVLLINVTSRNQELNDRMIEYAMHDRDNRGSAVVVQSPQPSDNSAVLTLTAKLEEMQKKMAESQAKAEKAVAEAESRARQAALDAISPKTPSPQELEIQRLKILLENEKKQAAEEKEKRRQEDLEAYRRKHYPELYEQPPVQTRHRSASRKQQSVEDIIDDIDSVIDSLDDNKAINYFDVEDDEDDRLVHKTKTPSRKALKKKKTETQENDETVEKEKPTPGNGVGGWRIPNE